MTPLNGAPRAISLLTLSTLALLAPAAAASPGFLAPIVLRSPSTTVTGSPAVAVASGRVVAAWQQNFGRRAFGIAVRRATTTGHLGAVEVFPGGGYQPSVAAGRSGGAAVIWQSSQTGGIRHVEVSIASGGGRFHPRQTLASGRGNLGSVRVLATGGHYLAIWDEGLAGTDRRAVRYAVSDAAGRFAGTQTLASDSGVLGVSSAAAPDGTVTAAWDAPPLAGPGTIHQVAFAQLAPGAASFGPEGGFAAPRGSSSAGASQAAAGPGASAVTWTEGGPLELLRAALLTRGAPPAPATVFSLSTPDASQLYAFGPVIAMPGGGLEPIAAWSVVEGPGGEAGVITTGRVFAAERRADGSYGVPVQLSTPGTIASLAGAAATSSKAVVTWATGNFGRYALWYAVRSGAGPLGPARALEAAHAERGAVLASSPGAVAAVWVTRPGHSRRGVTLAVLRDRG